MIVSPAQRQTAPIGEESMHSTNMRQIKAAIRDQAFVGSARVSCAIGQVVAIRRRQGQFLALVRGWGWRWYPVESVRVEYAGCTFFS
jgi:hypothetical protein